MDPVPNYATHSFRKSSTSFGKLSTSSFKIAFGHSFKNRHFKISSKKSPRIALENLPDFFRYSSKFAPKIVPGAFYRLSWRFLPKFVIRFLYGFVQPKVLSSNLLCIPSKTVPFFLKIHQESVWKSTMVLFSSVFFSDIFPVVH